jgi:hypothetical protein
MMVRTTLATVLLLGLIGGGLALVQSSRPGTTQDLPAQFQPDRDLRELTPVVADQESPEQFLERTARQDNMTKRLGFESESGEFCGPNCCGDDRVPTREELVAMGWPLPADSFGRWMSPSTAHLEVIPVPMIDWADEDELPLFRVLSDEEILPDDNEPTSPPSGLDGPSLSGADNAAAEDAPAPTADPEADPATESTTDEPQLSEPERLVLPDSTKPKTTETKPVSPKVTPKKPAATNNPKTNPPKEVTVPVPPQASAATYPKELDPLKRKIRNTLAHYYFRRQEDVAKRSPWGVMHCLISYGVDAQVKHDGKSVNAIGWLCYNGVCQNQNLFYTDKETGKIQARIGVGVQGHAGQFLAMMAQSKVKADFPMLVEKEKFTIEDLLEYEQHNIRAGTELTFKLIGFSHYLNSDAKWKNDLDEDWDIPRVIREELKQPIVGAACGGTHRLMGLSYAVANRKKQKQPVDGQWLRAEQFTQSYQQYLFRLQNSDGSFSTDWFARKADNGKYTRKLETTGHMLEWLVYSLPQEKLTDPRVIRSVNFLADLLMATPYEEWKIGPQGHALHALALYDERVFGGRPGERAAELANVIKAQPQSRR